MPNEPQWIVWHTAAHGSDGRDHDTSAQEIDEWHRANEWRCIGYHYVVRKGGQVEEGRAENESGAHVKGLNTRSVGICFSGHGDIAPHTPAQRAAGLQLTTDLMQRHAVPAENVIGHREINLLIEDGSLDPEFRTSKSCPGTLVDMDEVRASLG